MESGAVIINPIAEVVGLPRVQRKSSFDLSPRRAWHLDITGYGQSWFRRTQLMEPLQISEGYDSG
jgi:hypothetical protein